MSSVICLAGLSNSGKSSSMGTLNPKSTFIVSCTNKQLQIPGFRKKYPKIAIKDKKLVGNWLINNNYEDIEKYLKVVSKTRLEIKNIIIDDTNYLLSSETFANALTKGYEKFSVMAKNYYDLIQFCQTLRDDITVVLVTHIENYGTELDPLYRIWTTGKMLTSQINLDGLFSYIIYSEKFVNDKTDEIEYRFKTRTDGNDTCRSVRGCFKDKYIKPDLKFVIDRINEFEYGDGELIEEPKKEESEEELES